jgi:hypothetical protein
MSYQVMTNAIYRYIATDPITLESAERRKRIERQDWAFVMRLRTAILNGLESPAGVLGHQHGPRRRHARVLSGQANARF